MNIGGGHDSRALDAVFLAANSFLLNKKIQYFMPTIKSVEIIGLCFLSFFQGKSDYFVLSATDKYSTTLISQFAEQIIPETNVSNLTLDSTLASSGWGKL